MPFPLGSKVILVLRFITGRELYSQLTCAPPKCPLLPILNISAKSSSEPNNLKGEIVKLLLPVYNQ